MLNVECRHRKMCNNCFLNRTLLVIDNCLSFFSKSRISNSWYWPSNQFYHYLFIIILRLCSQSTKNRKRTHGVDQWGHSLNAPAEGVVDYKNWRKIARYPFVWHVSPVCPSVHPEQNKWIEKFRFFLHFLCCCCCCWCCHNPNDHHIEHKSVSFHSFLWLSIDLSTPKISYKFFNVITADLVYRLQIIHFHIIIFFLNWKPQNKRFCFAPHGASGFG